MRLIRFTSRGLILFGVIIAVLGIIFTLQGKSIVGPSTSFMYSNHDWVFNGYIIAAIGLTITGVGLMRSHVSKNSQV
jgi:hypothetical protein